MNGLQPYETTVSSSGIDPDWDDLVLQTATAHHEQTSLWGDAQRFAGWRASRVLVRQGGKLVGGAQILDKPLGPLGHTIGYLNRGPVVVTDDPALTRAVLEAVKRHARQRRMIYLAVVPPYDGDKFLTAFAETGFAVSPNSLPPSTAMRSTTVVDLVPDEEAILMNMRRTTRQIIRKALKGDLVVRRGTVDDLETFKEMLRMLCRRRGVPPNIPLNGFVHDLWAKFAPSGKLQFFMAEKQGEVVATLLVFTCGRWARAWRYGSTGAHREDYPNDLMYWEAIKATKAEGFHFFDITGFDTKYARALVEGRVLPPEEICKISLFKQGFGGKILVLNDNYCYFPNPVVRFLFKKLGPRLTSSGIFERLEKLVSKRA
ncbi:MAG: GNAT family N-acetyltransferase [Verrucomicrobia bacterium]|nr:GNAT family N-acetyltransferase [Verrucomicrobiota bacterium]